MRALQTHEEPIESFYGFSAGHGIDLVPGVQYVHRPSGTDSYIDTLVATLRIKAKL